MMKYILFTFLICIADIAIARDIPVFFEEEFSKEIKYNQVGNDLIVTKMITINNSPHILKTDYYKTQDGNYILRYTVLQNFDLYRRSRKNIFITWNILNHKKSDKIKYEIEENILTLDNKELQKILK